MSTRALPLVYEPVLVEEVVFHVMRGHADERAFRRERDRLYLIPEGDDREAAFRQFHTAWFERLGLFRPVDVALGELPILTDACDRCLVTPAPTRPDEGADLLVASNRADSVERSIIIRLRPVAFADPEGVLSLLRAELLHVADMLDPVFGYEPTLQLLDGGPSYDRLVRDRYRALWDTSVAGRLLRRGVAAAEIRDRACRAFTAAFPMLGANADSAFERFFDTKAPTHAAFVAFANAPGRCDLGRGLLPGGRCPLCRFPTHAPEPTPEHLADDVVACITGDFPSWRPVDGLCRQCADLYRARPLSLMAAAMLPSVIGTGK